MPRTLTPEPLTIEAYAPFGDVLAASPRGEAGKPVNQGYARRHDRLVSLENLRPGATANVCLFRSTPRPPPSLTVELLERHPASTQLFIPMGARRYLTLVALGQETPDLTTLRAFLCTGLQGVSYRPGVWHHPLIALDDVADFACVVHEDDGPGDCDVAPLPLADRPVVLLP
jgi:ureidoglycolate lyase